jgi:ABC-2 type transport system permease protein
MSVVQQSQVLGGRAIREMRRTPESLIPTVFIPLFFLIVNVGQAGRIFPAGTTAFLYGQSYAAFQLPSSLLLAASFGGAALYLVEDIEGGYFDKLRAAPVSRSALVMGRLHAEGLKSVLVALALVTLALPFGVHIASGLMGLVLILALTSMWAVVYAGFMQLIALKTRSAAATNSGGLIFFPLLFLTPNFVPRELLTPPMEVAATFNPVTYIMEALRSLILQGFEWAPLARGFAVVGILGVVMVFLNIRFIRDFD